MDRNRDDAAPRAACGQIDVVGQHMRHAGMRDHLNGVPASRGDSHGDEDPRRITLVAEDDAALLAAGVV
jgi:hypothetical protein